MNAAHGRKTAAGKFENQNPEIGTGKTIGTDKQCRSYRLRPDRESAFIRVSGRTTMERKEKQPGCRRSPYCIFLFFYEETPETGDGLPGPVLRCSRSGGLRQKAGARRTR